MTCVTMDSLYLRCCLFTRFHEELNMAEEQKKETEKPVAKKTVAKKTAAKKTVTKKTVAKTTAAKKTATKTTATKKKVTKKRVVRRKTIAVETLMERAAERGSISEVNKAAVKQFKASQTAINQADRKFESAKVRVEKAAAAVGNSKSEKQKALAKTRLDAAKAAVREATVQRGMVAKEEKSAVVLLTKLDKLYDKGYAAFVKGYEKNAKAAAKPKNIKRRAAKKKAVKKD
jgi:hypothetical protein